MLSVWLEALLTWEFVVVHLSAHKNESTKIMSKNLLTFKKKSIFFLKMLSVWSEALLAWEFLVSSLVAVVCSDSRPWSQHLAALQALLALGEPGLVMIAPNIDCISVHVK